LPPGIGGPPIVYDYGYNVQPSYGVPYGTPAYGPEVYTPPARPAAAQPAVPRAQAAAPAPQGGAGKNVAQNTTPRPTAVRGVPEEEPARPRPAAAPPAAVAMPSPDQLNLGGARPADAGLDWTAARGQLQDLGAVSFQVDKLPGGAFQFTCFLPTAEAGKTHRVEAHGATEAEAVRRAIDEARRWRDQR
jgi:hypothetical protein